MDMFVWQCRDVIMISGQASNDWPTLPYAWDSSRHLLLIISIIQHQKGLEVR